ncbi:hypothetical protein BFX80_13205 [Cobetia marina]|jgi:hypothetical protein|nr:hypothetical protein BFX80_13205 [Cobetia marina]
MHRDTNMTSELLWGLGGIVLGGFVGFLLARHLPRRHEWNAAVRPLLATLREAEPEVIAGRPLEVPGDQLEAFRAVASHKAFYRFTSGVEYLNLQLAAAGEAHHDRHEQQALLDDARLTLATLQDRLRPR